MRVGSPLNLDLIFFLFSAFMDWSFYFYTVSDNKYVNRYIHHKPWWNCYWTLWYIWEEIFGSVSWQSRCAFSYDELSHCQWTSHMFRHMVLFLWSLKFNLFYVAHGWDNNISFWILGLVSGLKVFCFGQRWKYCFIARHTFRKTWILLLLGSFSASSFFIITWWWCTMLYGLHVREILLHIDLERQLYRLYVVNHSMHYYSLPI